MSIYVVRGVVRGTAVYGAVQYSTVQYSTVQYSTVQYSTCRSSRCLKDSWCRIGQTVFNSYITFSLSKGITAIINSTDICLIEENRSYQVMRDSSSCQVIQKGWQVIIMIIILCVCVCVCVCACPSYEEMLEYYYKKRSYLMQDATRNSFHMSEYNTHDPIYLI